MKRLTTIATMLALSTTLALAQSGGGSGGSWRQRWWVIGRQLRWHKRLYQHWRTKRRRNFVYAGFRY